MHTRTRRLLGIMVIIAVCIASAYWWYQKARTVEIIISDTQQALPQQITLIRGVRDVLVIRNESQQNITVAGTTLKSGQQFRQYYRSTGDYSFNCSVHNGQTLHVVVREP